MKQMLTCMLLLCMLLPFRSIAQSKTITGTVVDANDGAPLGLLSVKIKGTTKGALTNTQGYYTLSASEGDILVFTYIGYLPTELKVGAANTMDVKLKRDAKQLKEVNISTSYGIQKAGRSLGYSAPVVSGEEIAGSKRENFLMGLAGRVPGATVTSSSGAPGASVNIVLRGAVSMSGNNQPLMVIDGLPISNNTPSQDKMLGASTTAGTVLLDRTADYANRGIDINPEDIASITILKGPEAVTMYGSEGASGAIVITTKKPKPGKGKVSYDNSFRWETLKRLPSIQAVYGPGRNGVDDYTQRVFGGTKYTDTTQLFDNIHNFFQTGFTQRHNLSVSGGTETASVLLSAGYIDQSGVIPTTRFQKSTIRLVGSVKLSPKAYFQGSATYVSSNNIKASRGTGGVLLSLLTWPVNDDVRDYMNEDGSRRKIGGGTENDNPFYDVYKNRNTDLNDRLLGNVKLGIDILPWLNLEGIVGADVYTTRSNMFRHPESRTGVATNGFISDYSETSRLINSVVKATINKRFGKFNNTLVLSSTYDDNRLMLTSQRGEKLSVPDFNSINNADPATIAANRNERNFRKWAMFANYSFDYNRLIYISGTYRYDYASKLALPNVPGRAPGYKVPGFDFWGTSLSYVFTEHGLFKHQNILSEGRLRFSYSSAGKEPYEFYIMGNKYSPNSYQGGGYLANSTSGNPNITPEYTYNLEMGTELQFFKKRLGIDFAYYRLRSVKQLLNVRTSYGTGAVLIFLNGGEIRNEGMEIQVKGAIVQKKNFDWNMTVNFDRNVGRIVKMPADVPEFSDTRTFGAGDVRPITKPNSFTSSLTTRKYARNKNGDILIDATTGMPIKETDYSIVADRAPKFKMGIVNDIRFGSFVFTLNTDIRYGGDVYNGNEAFLYENMLSRKTLDRENPRIIKGVVKDGFENTDHPTWNNTAVTPYYYNSYYNIGTSTAGFSDEDFIEKNIKWIRVRDVTLSYNVPRKFLSRTKLISGARIYVTVTDPILITNYSGADPMANYNTPAIGGYGSVGIDYGSIAAPIGYNVGLSVNF
ncbi:TonB-linked SusC/RagA family outer membrane protein [Chitinophaga skermanii]|uniref:TonB-linked SusC/RagA family outer membrane protein n=1 Tax=Chitinophaga skermanii TaxID=331697 RepID=A0A327R2T4_9BACT|nr:SusC/RagA family TonB-linked outer membrane protein [Chitinophaga skermanii]RAJ10941.1 TonB-linked SusC/RagA family outer membrane protein [Chitinophaga skermanii]